MGWSTGKGTRWPTVAVIMAATVMLLMGWLHLPVVWIPEAQIKGPHQFQLDAEGRPIREQPLFFENWHRMATALIVGQRKCGTGTLRKFLSMNPFIKTPKNENTYFDTMRAYLPGSFFYKLSLPRAGPFDTILDDRPNYFSTQGTHERIARMNPHMKLLVVLRDPTTRALSDYVHLQLNDRLSAELTFEEVVLKEDGSINEEAYIISQGNYLRDLQHLLEYFLLENILILDGEDFVRNPVPILKKAEAFIGAPDYLRPTDFVYDKHKGFYCEKIGNSTSCMEDTKGRPHPKIAPELMHKLRAHFSPLNKALKHFLKVDWKWLR